MATDELEFLQRPAHHHYCFGLIRLFWELVVQGATSLGSASAALGLVRKYLPAVSRVPTDDCGQMWLLRIGLYELQRPKEQAADRVWIVDHTVQIGTTKCLLIVSCRLSWWRQELRPLRHQDLEVLALEPVDQSNGEVVRRQLEATAATVGVPRAIVSDHGADLQRGIKAFQEQHPETASSYDIAHKLAILLKRELATDERWPAYLREMGQTKPRLQQTELAYLNPPTLKNKARYMNLESVVAWGVKTLRYLDDPHPVDDQPVDKQKLEEKLGWLRQHRPALAAWDALQQVISATLHYVRHQGYHRQAAEELQQQLESQPSASLNRRFADQVLVFIQEQSAAAQEGERLIGSSEVIESLIGRGKRMEAQQSKSGFTRMILGMAAAVVTPTQNYLAQALATVKTRDMLKWCREQLGDSVQAQRQRAFATPSGGTKQE